MYIFFSIWIDNEKLDNLVFQLLFFEASCNEEIFYMDRVKFGILDIFPCILPMKKRTFWKLWFECSKLINTSSSKYTYSCKYAKEDKWGKRSWDEFPEQGQ